MLSSGLNLLGANQLLSTAVWGLLLIAVMVFRFAAPSVAGDVGKCQEVTPCEFGPSNAGQTTWSVALAASERTCWRRSGPASRPGWMITSNHDTVRQIGGANEVRHLLPLLGA